MAHQYIPRLRSGLGVVTGSIGGVDPHAHHSTARRIPKDLFGGDPMRLHRFTLSVTAAGTSRTGGRSLQQRQPLKRTPGPSSSLRAIEQDRASIELLQVQAPGGEVALQRREEAFLLLLGDRSVVVRHRLR